MIKLILDQQKLLQTIDFTYKVKKIYGGFQLFSIHPDHFLSSLNCMVRAFECSMIQTLSVV